MCTCSVEGRVESAASFQDRPLGLCGLSLFLVKWPQPKDCPCEPHQAVVPASAAPVEDRARSPRLEGGIIMPWSRDCSLCVATRPIQEDRGRVARAVASSIGSAPSCVSLSSSRRGPASPSYREPRAPRPARPRLPTANAAQPAMKHSPPRGVTGPRALNRLGSSTSR